MHCLYEPIRMSNDGLVLSLAIARRSNDDGTRGRASLQEAGDLLPDALFSPVPTSNAAMDDWRTETGLTREEFAKFTQFCNRSDNDVDNRNRAVVIGLLSENVRVAPGAIVRLKDFGSIKRNTYIGLYSYVNGDVTIGEDVLVGPHCSITSNNHVFAAGTRSFSGNQGEPIVIGDGCWLAAGVMVTAGVRVGRGNLICANAVVTRSTPDFAIMVGTPARQVGSIDPATGAYRWFARDGVA